MKIFLLYLIVSCSYLYSQKELTLDEIFSNKNLYPAPSKEIQWIDKGNKYSYVGADNSSILQYNIAEDKESVLVSANDLKTATGKNEFVIENYKWSPKENFILFTGEISSRSLKTGGSFAVYDIKEKNFILNVVSEYEQTNIIFSPDESMIGFVRNNDIYIIEVKSGKEKRLTFDGNTTILNGVFDWAYEEEFSIIEGWCWSPDSKHIAFWHTDQSDVPLFPITAYDSVYNQVYMQRYPKPGYPVSAVKIGVVNTETGKNVWMNTGSNEDIYIPRIKFTNEPGTLSIQKLNRLQNKLELLFADIKTGETNIILTEEDEHWVDVWDHLTFLKSENKFIWPSERDGYLHLYLYDYTGNIINQITKGRFETDKLLGVDEEKNLVYYISNERSVIQSDLYSCALDGSVKKRLTSSPGNHEINLSPYFNYFTDKYSNVNKLPSLSLFTADGKLIKEFGRTDMSFIDAFNFSPVDIRTFYTSDSTELYCSLIKPHNFEQGKKYPLIIFNYSGPGSQSVKDSWDSFDYLLAQLYAQNGFMVFTVDNRGTKGRGKEFVHVVYKNLGKWELNDITEGISYLNRIGYIDTTRVCITGSSYGGYMSLLALLKKPDYFKMAVAVASVTDWKNYDAIYTERYMQDPASNPSGYSESSAFNYINNLKGKLLIVHGTSDDNVHLSNSIELAARLIEANKKFDIMIYPGKKHGGFGRHYYKLVTDYIINNL